MTITAGHTYVASYHTNRVLLADGGQFNGQGVDNAPLHAPASVGGAGNGLYAYGPSGFPTVTYEASNYWVDVVFSTAAATPPAAPTGVTAAPVRARRR